MMDTPSKRVRLAAAGNHLSGLSRSFELTDRDGRLIGPARTRALYRLYARGGGPFPKPGVVEVGEGRGAALEVELWDLPETAIAELATLTVPPVSMGQVVLESGEAVHGYLCDPAGLGDARDVTAFGGWRAFLAMSAAKP
jgi:allophanate hydrolase